MVAGVSDRSLAAVPTPKPGMKGVAKAVGLSAGLFLAACASESGEAPAGSVSAELAAEIESLCGLPAGALTGKAPVSDAMPKLACAIEEARKRNVALGFVSNPVEPDR